MVFCTIGWAFKECLFHVRMSFWNKELDFHLTLGIFFFFLFAEAVHFLIVTY